MDLIDVLKDEPLSFLELKEKLNLDDITLAKIISPLENKVIFKNKQNKYELYNHDVEFGYIVYKNNVPYIVNNNMTMRINEYSINNQLYPNDEYLFTVAEFYEQKLANLDKFIKHSKEPILFKKGKRSYYNQHVNFYNQVKVLNAPSEVKEGTFILAIPCFRKENGIELVRFERICNEAKDFDEDVFDLIINSKVPYIFSDLYNDELNNIKDVDGNDLKDRLDLTNDIIFTIDGDDAKDFDDALSIKKIDDGYLVGVHIADVSYYVKENTLIDEEALKRGTSIYLANKVIPMLGERLSNELCSLQENKIRLTLSVFINFDNAGNIINYDIKKTFIKSKRRMTYDLCNKMLKGDNDIISMYNDIYPSLSFLNELAIILRQKRKDNGSIFFETEEMEIKFDHNGNVVGLEKRSQDLAEMLVEEMMLKANQCVANFLNNLNYPCVYRVHDEANHEKLKELKAVLSSLGLHLNLSGSGVKSKDIQKLLDEVKGQDQELFISNILLRSMAKAIYFPECTGHFGLAMKEYLHFTSPIRRYPDLFVHRVLHHLYLDKIDDFKEEYNHFEHLKNMVSNVSTNTEIRATKLERDVLDYYLCVYADKLPDNKYSGYINSITEYGMYITLENGIEGLAHVRSFDEYLYYDPKKHVLVGEMTNDCYNIGDKVLVRIYDVDRKNRYIDFKVIYHKKENKK